MLAIRVAPRCHVGVASWSSCRVSTTITVAIRAKLTITHPKVNWYYATNNPIRPPTNETNKKTEFEPFTRDDLKKLERAWQRLHHSKDKLKPELKLSVVPVKEDGLLEVDLDAMELAPIYWEGAVYEVRRGLWFDGDGKPLSTPQTKLIEDNYQKIIPKVLKQHSKTPEAPKLIRPKKNVPPVDLASGENSASFLESLASYVKDVPDYLYGLALGFASVAKEAPNAAIEGAKAVPTKIKGAASVAKDVPQSAWENAQEMIQSVNDFAEHTHGDVDIAEEVDIIELSPTHNLIYLLQTQAAIFPKEYKQRIQIDILRSLGPSQVPFLKVSYIYRGYHESFDLLVLSPQKIPALSKTFETEFRKLINLNMNEAVATDDAKKEQLIVESDLEPEAPANRKIDHLVFCIHGIGQVLGDKYKLINFTHSINLLRKTMTRVYKLDPLYQSLHDNDPGNTGIQVLPILWRHRIDFHPNERFQLNQPGQNLPSLLEINAEGVKPLRNVVGDVVLDVLLFYEPYYFNQVMRVVADELNKVYKLYKKNNPDFNGKVHILGHSLGSAIGFDLACLQGELDDTFSTTYGADGTQSRGEGHKLDFDIDNLFCVGSPVGMFNLLKQKSLAPYTPNAPDWQRAPKCTNLYNMYHPCDPVAYRMEPLVDPSFASYLAELVPFATESISKKLMSLNEFKDDISEKLSNATLWLLESKEKRAIALGDVDTARNLVENENALGDILSSIAVMDNDSLNGRKTKMTQRDLQLLTPLNRTGRIDYTLPMGVFDFSLVSAVSAHVSYFDDEDTAGFLLREILRGDLPPVRERTAYRNDINGKAT